MGQTTGTGTGTHPPAGEQTSANQSDAAALTRYVRIRGVLKNAFIEFDFAIGDPSLYVELVLPKAAFDAFCRHNDVVMMTEEQAHQVDLDMEKWRYGEAAQK